VIIPTRNRPERLQRCLAALCLQDVGRDRFEVIIVDDGSETSLEPVAARFRDQLQLHLIHQPNAGPARARNVGAAHASGHLLAFTDDDCEPCPHWLTALLTRSQRSPDHLIGGHTVNALPDNLCSAASQMLIDYLYEHHAGITAATAAAPPFFTSNNFAVSADLFRHVGGFAESFPLAAGEDRELCDRWQERGYRLLHEPSAIVEHWHRSSLVRFWRQHQNYGRGAWHLRRERITRGRPPLGVEPLTFYRRLVTYPLRVDSPHRAVPLMGLMLLSQVANTIGFLSERYRRQVPAAARLSRG
jgi:glycosyltransferase involved in cell wall biosynthesis